MPRQIAKGKMFEFNGRVIELFPIGELGKAVGRDPVTLRKWEQVGFLPRTYRDECGRRLYSAGQIKAMRRILIEENIRSGMAVLKTQFKQKLAEAFKNLLEKGDDYYDKETTGTGAIAGAINTVMPNTNGEGKV